MPGTLAGTFELGLNRVSGEVIDETEAKFNPITVSVQRAGKTILKIETERVGDTYAYRFNASTNDLFAPAELLADKIQLVAASGFGHTGTLRLDGASGLELVREHLGVPAQTLCDVSFNQNGNSRDFIGAGWSGPEEHYTWTEDDDSFINLPRLGEPGSYAIRLTCGAMVPAPHCAGQAIDVLLNKQLIWSQYITQSHPQFFEIKFDGKPFINRPLQLCLHHPDALRLADFVEHGDPRRLAFSVKRLLLVRFI